MEKTFYNYTIAENHAVEKNKFSISHLTEFIQKRGIYSLLQKLFLYKLHKKSGSFQEYQGSKAQKYDW